MLILDFMDDLFHRSWYTTISRIQEMFHDTRQPRAYSYMDLIDGLGYW